jgi:preprotein translocase subunit SecE
MNREQKRALQKAGQLNSDGTQAAPTRDRRAPAQSSKGERTRPLEFLREVRGELRKVTWPTRPEVARLSLVVFITLVVFIAAVFLVDTGFAEFFSWLMQTGRESGLGAAGGAGPI